METLSGTGRNQARPPESSSGVYLPPVVRFLEVVAFLWFAFSAKMASHRVGCTQAVPRLYQNPLQYSGYLFSSHLKEVCYFCHSCLLSCHHQPSKHMARIYFLPSHQILLTAPVFSMIPSIPLSGLSFCSMPTKPQGILDFLLSVAHVQ